MAKGVRIVSGGEKVTSEGLVGATVEQVRADYADVINIPADATVTVNGQIPAKGQKLANGDEVVFSRPLGQRAASPDLLPLG